MMRTTCGMSLMTIEWLRSLNPVSRMLRLTCSSISTLSFCIYDQNVVMTCRNHPKNMHMIAESLCTNLRNIQNYLVSIFATRKLPLLRVKASFLVAERVTRMHWKSAEEYQCYAIWWSPASCSSTSPASGWTNSRPSQSQGPFQIGTSCVHMEVRDCTIIIFNGLWSPWTTKILCCAVSYRCLLLLLCRYWALKNVNRTMNF